MGSRTRPEPTPDPDPDADANADGKAGSTPGGNLRGVDLSGADLSGVDHSGAGLDERARRRLAACHDFLAACEAESGDMDDGLLPAELGEGVEIGPPDRPLPLSNWERLKATGSTEDLAQTAGELAAALPYIRRMESALAKLPSHVGVVETRLDLPAPVAALIAPGAILREAGFLQSTAGRYFRRGAWRLVIWSETGRKLGDYAQHPERREVLFPPATRFRILAVESGRSATHLFLEEIAD